MIANCLSKFRLFVLISALYLLHACKENSASKAPSQPSDSLTEEQQRLPENALKGLAIAEGLHVTVMATEPMLKNPTNIDVDDKGRVWVTEAYNYRPDINGNPVNEKGDRIVILQDMNGDGIADSSKVFFQGPELNAPLGICVLDKKVIVSQSPYVWAFYDDNNDDIADRKEIMFQGIGGEQHDHGVHSFSFGPDGKLYFNFGNEGRTLKDKNGRVVRDQDGDEIGPKKYKQGMVFRCDPDGSNVECLGHNFRNNYEAAIDSYGIIWQSDNDDDGNRGVRINYVMDYGNYGYTDEMSGAGWQANRTNIEDSIPLRHWHLNDPGVVPNLLQTGGGSPTGMIVYEGDLLPKRFHNQVIHCDAGPNVVRSYPVKKDGAGYTASIENLLKGEKDQWFRPADICVAPDGSLIVADWYDPGVGGHQAGDQQRGRIYRVAPKNSKYTIPTLGYTSPKGAVAALQNPNLAVRNKAFNSLKSMGESAIQELEKRWQSSPNPRMRARAFWVLVTLSAKSSTYIQQAIKEDNPDLRIMGIRAARLYNSDVINIVSQLADDKDAQVHRECALALRHNKSPQAAELWTRLAMQYDGKDRWYLEALGIGADGQWDLFFSAWLKKVKDPLQSQANHDIIWRARTDLAVPHLAQLASQQNVDLKNRLRYFRAFDFNQGPAKAKLLLGIIEKNTSNDPQLNKLALRHLDIKTVRQSAVAQNALTNVLNSIRGTPEYLELVWRYEMRNENKNLLQLALDQSGESLGRDAARLLLELKGDQLVWNVINGDDSSRSRKLLQSLAGVGTDKSIDMLQRVALSKQYPSNIRFAAAERIGRSWNGEERVLELLKNKKVPADLIPAVVSSVSQAWRGNIRAEAASYLPNSSSATKKKTASLSDLMKLSANASNGAAVFKNICATCHQVNNQGFDFGPKLSEIGSKLPKEGLLDAIVNPSAGISFGYEGWQIDMKDGSTLTGIISTKTETDIELKYPGGSSQKIKTSDVKSMKQLKESMMPGGLHQVISHQDLADLLEYMANLKRAGK
jgi:putative membrane-bound dehydrogenase-like protein